MAQKQKTAKAEFKPNWKQIESGDKLFRLGAYGSYWKGKIGWWASRKGIDGFRQFRGPVQARTWVEEPLLETFCKQIEEKEIKRKKRCDAKDAKIEAKARNTWGVIPVEDRTLKVGQVWAMKDPAYSDRQILLLAVRNDSIVVLARVGEVPWEACQRDVRSITGLLRLYFFVRYEDVEALL